MNKLNVEIINIGKPELSQDNKSESDTFFFSLLSRSTSLSEQSTQSCGQNG